MTRDDLTPQARQFLAELGRILIEFQIEQNKKNAAAKVQASETTTLATAESKSDKSDRLLDSTPVPVTSQVEN